MDGWLERRRRRRLLGARGRDALATELSQAAAGRERVDGPGCRCAGELADLAALVMEVEEPPLPWIVAVHELIDDRRSSPLHSELAHESEVLAVLYYLRRPWLERWGEQCCAHPGDPGDPPAPALTPPACEDGAVAAGRGDDARFAPRGRGRSA